MMKSVINISAKGTRGLAEGKLFSVKKDSSGRYVLNKKKSSYSTEPTNKAINKVYADSLNEAATLLATDDYLINLVDESGKRALRAFSKVEIKYL